MLDTLFFVVGGIEWRFGVSICTVMRRALCAVRVRLQGHVASRLSTRRVEKTLVRLVEDLNWI